MIAVSSLHVKAMPLCHKTPMPNSGFVPSDFPHGAPYASKYFSILQASLGRKHGHATYRLMRKTTQKIPCSSCLRQQQRYNFFYRVKVALPFGVPLPCRQQLTPCQHSERCNVQWPRPQLQSSQNLVHKLPSASPIVLWMSLSTKLAFKFLETFNSSDFGNILILTTAILEEYK